METYPVAWIQLEISGKNIDLFENVKVDMDFTSIKKGYICICVTLHVPANPVK